MGEVCEDDAIRNFGAGEVLGCATANIHQLRA